MENWFWKGLWTCRQVEYVVVVMMMMMMMMMIMMMMNTEHRNIFIYPTVFEIAIIGFKNHSHLYCVMNAIDTVNFS